MSEKFWSRVGMIEPTELVKASVVELSDEAPDGRHYLNCPVCNGFLIARYNVGNKGRKFFHYDCIGKCQTDYRARDLIANHLDVDGDSTDGKKKILAWLQDNFTGFKDEKISEISKTAADETFDGVKRLSDVFDDLDTMAEDLQKTELKWGFEILDDKLPLLPGCYLLGALPSMGKTTLALQVAAHICEQGTPILYISYEPTDKQIAVKDLARYWFLKEWGKTSRSDFVPTALQIMLGKYWHDWFTHDDMVKVRTELQQKRENFYFLQGERATAQDLVAKIKPFVNKGVKFIVIDYLQLIKGADAKKSTREQIDDTIRELQIFQSENNLVILFISSFNRENYRNYVCMEAFKESGGLEFTADAVLGLQLAFETGESRGDTELFQQKKQKHPRTMELVCLKNRYGIDFTDRFAYHSAHETFIESKVPAQNKSFAKNFDED